MTYRAAKFLATGLISCLAAATLLAAAHETVEAAENCLAAPKGAAPQGGHWYYRVDRTTKRPCWYVRNEAKALQQASKPGSSPAPPTATALQDSVANARAEMPASSEPGQRSAAPQDQRTPETTRGDDVASGPINANAGGWSLASRWSNADAGDGRQAVEDSDSAAAKRRLQAAATKPPAEVQGNSFWVLLAALGSALLVAGVVIAGFVTFFRTRPTTSSENGLPPHADRSYDGRQIQSSVRSRDEPVLNWVRIAREIEAAKNPGRDVEELLARLPRRPLA